MNVIARERRIILYLEATTDNKINVIMYVANYLNEHRIQFSRQTQFLRPDFFKFPKFVLQIRISKFSAQYINFSLTTHISILYVGFALCFRIERQWRHSISAR